MTREDVAREMAGELESLKHDLSIFLKRKERDFAIGIENSYDFQTIVELRTYVSLMLPLVEKAKDKMHLLHREE